MFTADIVIVVVLLLNGRSQWMINSSALDVYYRITTWCATLHKLPIQRTANVDGIVHETQFSSSYLAIGKLTTKKRQSKDDYDAVSSSAAGLSW